MQKWIILSFVLLASLISPAYAEEAADKKFTITTTAVLDEGGLPVLYTCDGKDLQPQFSWTNVPDKTQTLAFIMSDPDAPGGTFYHWILYNIPKSTTSLDEGMTKAPAGATFGKNSFGKEGYKGPCPPKGSAHTYIINLYALDSKLSVPAGADAKTVLAAMKSHIVGEAKFTTTYSRWPQ